MFNAVQFELSIYLPDPPLDSEYPIQHDFSIDLVPELIVNKKKYVWHGSLSSEGGVCRTSFIRDNFRCK